MNIEKKIKEESKIFHFYCLKWIFLLFLGVIFIFGFREISYLKISIALLIILTLINTFIWYSEKRKQKKFSPNLLLIGDILILSILTVLNIEYFLRFIPYLYVLLIVSYGTIGSKEKGFLLATLFSLLYLSYIYPPYSAYWLNLFNLNLGKPLNLNYYEVFTQISFLYLVAFLIFYLNREKDNLLEEKNQLIDNLYQTNKALAKSKEEIKAYNQTLKVRLETQQIARDAIRHAYHTIETIVENIGSGLVVINKEGKIIVFNKQAEKITGFTALEAINKRCREIMKNDLCARSCPFSYPSEEPFLSSGYGLTLLNKFNREIPVIISHSSLKDEEGNTVGAVEVFTDISEIKNLKELNSEFVTLVSHELKAPLTVAKGYASVLLKEKLGKINEEQRERLLKIEQYMDKLNEILNNLLEFSKINVDSIKMEKVSLSNIIREVVETFKQEIKNKELEFELKEDEKNYFVLGDTSSLERVFINLLNNAIKYTSPKGKISIEVKGEKDSIEVYITDNGIGILPEDMPRIFDKFYRSSAVSLDKEGVGLGLSIVKRILDLHKANIKVSSEVNKGTQFCISFNKIMV